jgi:D-alanine-D-alanine ligase
LSFNKWACNSFLSAFGIATAKSILLRKGEQYISTEIADSLGFPCFVKPNDGGSSFGITKVKTLDAISTAIERAFEEGDEVVIESFIAGREFTCGLYKVGTQIIPLPPTEIFSENDFFDYEAKYQGKSKEVTPANLTAEQTKQMQDIAVKAFNKIGLRSIARVDFMLHPDGTFYVIEVNTNPGMTTASIIPQQIAAAGKNLQDVFTALIREVIA